MCLSPHLGEFDGGIWKRFRTNTPPGTLRSPIKNPWREVQVPVNSIKFWPAEKQRPETIFRIQPLVETTSIWPHCDSFTAYSADQRYRLQLSLCRRAQGRPCAIIFKRRVWNRWLGHTPQQPSCSSASRQCWTRTSFLNTTQRIGLLQRGFQ